MVVPNDANGHIRHKLFPLPGRISEIWSQVALEISDWWPHLGNLCRRPGDRPRSMWTTDNNHDGAMYNFTQAGTSLEGQFPTIGSWVHWGLRFAATTTICRGSSCSASPIADYTQRHRRWPMVHILSGTRAQRACAWAMDPRTRCRLAARWGPIVLRQEQAERVRVLERLNRGWPTVEYPDDT